MSVSRETILLADGSPSKPSPTGLALSLIERETMRLLERPTPDWLRPAIVDADGEPLRKPDPSATITIRRPPRYKP